MDVDRWGCVCAGGVGELVFCEMPCEYIPSFTLCNVSIIRFDSICMSIGGCDVNSAVPCRLSLTDLPKVTCLRADFGLCLPRSTATGKARQNFGGVLAGSFTKIGGEGFEEHDSHRK
jgi:hypothetical protein